MKWNNNNNNNSSKNKTIHFSCTMLETNWPSFQHFIVISSDRIFDCEQRALVDRVCVTDMRSHSWKKHGHFAWFHAVHCVLQYGHNFDLQSEWNDNLNFGENNKNCWNLAIKLSCEFPMDYFFIFGVTIILAGEEIEIASSFNYLSKRQR